jgi:hypothetical protein
MQALLFVEQGQVMLAPKPWQRGAEHAQVRRAEQLPAGVAGLVKQLLQKASQGAEQPKGRQAA